MSSANEAGGLSGVARLCWLSCYQRSAGEMYVALPRPDSRLVWIVVDLAPGQRNPPVRPARPWMIILALAEGRLHPQGKFDPLRGIPPEPLF